MGGLRGGDSIRRHGSIARAFDIIYDRPRDEGKERKTGENFGLLCAEHYGASGAYRPGLENIIDASSAAYLLRNDIIANYDIYTHKTSLLF